MRNSRLTLALLTLLPWGCSGSGRGDGGPDGRRDLRPTVDARREVSRDASREAAADRGVDARVVADLGGGDARPTQASILYTSTTDPASFGLRTVSTNKPGAPAPVPGWTGYLDLQPLVLTGLQEQTPVSADRPQVVGDQQSGFRGIRLPGGAGLYHVRRKLLGTSGLLLIGVDGTIQVIREVAGLYPETIGSHVALEPGGQLGAALSGAAGVFLFRTDKTPFPGGAAVWKDISAASSLTQVKVRSLTLVGGWLYAVGSDASSKDTLLRAPTDGSAPLGAVALPSSGGQTPASLAEGLTPSLDGKWLALTAGSSVALRDLYVVDVQSGVARNVTASPGILAERGDSFGGQSGQLAISPAGTLVAYLRGSQGSQELFVARADGTSAPVQVSSDARFRPEVVQFGGLLLVDEQNLLFGSGLTANQLEIFRWNQSSSQVSSLTGSGAAPFDGQGALSLQAAWISPSRGWWYLVLSNAAQQTADLLGVSLKTFTAIKVTSGAEVQVGAGRFAACPSSAAVFFAARPSAKLPANEIWSFDQETPQPAQKRTAVSVTGSSWTIDDLRLSFDCGRLAWGGGAYGLHELWLLETQGGAVRKLTPAPLFVGAASFSTDHATLIYGSGGSSTTSTLKAVPVAPGAPVTLDTSAGTVHVFAVY